MHTIERLKPRTSGLFYFRTTFGFMSIQDLPRFYAASASEGNTVELDSEEGKHARVLRIQLGDPVHVIDGKGGLYVGKALPSKKRFEVSNLQQVMRTDAPASSLTLAVAPTKNIARFEWVIEKAVEVGVDRIVPIFSEHSERSKLRLDRLERIALSAAKQSKELWVPIIEEPLQFDAFIQNAGASTLDSSLSRCNSAASDKRHDCRNLLEKQMQLIIGPEGDFSQEEVNQAYALGCHGLDLGQKRPENRNRRHYSGHCRCIDAGLKPYFRTMKQTLLLLTILLASLATLAQGQYSYRIGLLKYGGGGDWYANIETSLPNLVAFCNAETRDQY